MRKVTTRIMAVDTDAYNVYRASTGASERLGTKHAYSLHGSITAQLSPVRDSTSLEIYGNRCENMFTLISSKGADIELNDKVMIGGSYYKVIAVMSYTGHISATIEKVGVLNG